MDAERSTLEIAEQDGYVAVRFVGEFSVESFQRQAEAAVGACRKSGGKKLFVDSTCFDVSPSVTERYELAMHAAKISAGLKVALLLTPTFLDPNKFGIMVAQNRGLVVEAFTERAKAIAWLLA